MTDIPQRDPGVSGDNARSLAWPKDDPFADLSTCPYYRDQENGTCTFGCWTEPACFTDRPRDGWPSEQFDEGPNGGH